MSVKEFFLPGDINKAASLKAGELVLLSGIIYTARDQAHKRLIDAINKKAKLPVKLSESVIYYCGPTPAPKGRPIGSCGPTTSSRMDRYLATLMKNGLKITIGKGNRSGDAAGIIKRYKGAYFAAAGGAGAYYSDFVESLEVVAFPDLGAEAIARLRVRKMPVIVAIDSKGNSIFPSEYV